MGSSLSLTQLVFDAEFFPLELTHSSSCTVISLSILCVEYIELNYNHLPTHKHTVVVMGMSFPRIP